MGKAVERFKLFLMEHPEAKPIAEAKELIKILEFVEKNAASFETLKRELKLDDDKLSLALEALIAAKLIAKEQTATKIFYYANKIGREFIKLYKEASSEMLA